MSRALVYRAFSALCGIWLAFVLGEPAALHACAMHDAHGGMAHHSASNAPLHHGASGADQTHQGRKSHQPHHAPPCTCVGACCAAVAVAAQVATAPLSNVIALPHESPAVPSARAHRPSTFEYARPPTIGPPRLTV